MKRIFLVLGLFLASAIVMGQATFVISSLPMDTPSEDTIYIGGSFNGWNPGDTEYALEKNEDNNWFIVMPERPIGTTIEFKFTRGEWTTVEKSANGDEIANRQFTYGNGDTVQFDIANWAVPGGGSTAAGNVSILDEQFYMPQLDRSRRIWIYLPPGYDNSDESYPVLYMHDGQNIFDAFTSYVGEWEVDETLNRLASEGFQVPIVVGIDHGGTERINEYLPWINPQYGGGLGDEYVDFLVYTLKPYIDENFRTLPGREFTGIMGSSMGGLISQYGGLKYQDVFSKAGIFSPAYWISDSVWTFTNEIDKLQSMRIYQLIGGAEGAEYVAGMWKMHDTLTSIGFNDNELLSLEIAGGQHSENFWKNQFADAYLWMFASFASDINEIIIPAEIVISPNPVTDEIDLSEYHLDKNDTLEIIDMNGKIVVRMNIGNRQKVSVRELKSGSYILIVRSNGITYSGMFIKQ